MAKAVNPPSRRVRLASEMRKAIKPLLQSWGFDNPPKGSPDWFQTTRPNTWVRRRDGYLDEIYIVWDHYGGPIYAIEFMTDQVERMLPPRQKSAFGTVRFGDVLYRRLRLFGGFVDLQFEWSTGWLSLDQDIRRVAQRLTELNHYFLTGEVSHYIRLQRCAGSPDMPARPVFWWREGEDGEAYRRMAEEQRQKRLASRNKPQA